MTLPFKLLPSVELHQLWKNLRTSLAGHDAYQVFTELWVDYSLQGGLKEDLES